ncbi:MAG TPA: NADH-quinone oxidoreductase subunit M, partial [Nocardioides sp.]|nr:NADH-quinone oxidoreductase subunit M [Nocardioides sp.]
MNDLPWLTLLWAVPLVGALVTAFVPKAPGSVLPKQVGLAFAVLTLAVGVAIAAQYDTGDGMQLTETHTWIEAFGVHYALGVDGLGLLLILMTVALVPIVMVASWHEADDRS